MREGIINYLSAGHKQFSLPNIRHHIQDQVIPAPCCHTSKTWKCDNAALEQPLRADRGRQRSKSIQ